MQKYVFFGIFEHSQSPIDLKFWFYSKIYSRKVCQSKSFLLGIVKKSQKLWFWWVLSYVKNQYSFFFHVCQFWVHGATSAHHETHTKWKFEQFTTSEDIVWLSMDKHGASRQDLMFAIGDIYIVNQWFLKKKASKTPTSNSFF